MGISIRNGEGGGGDEFDQEEELHRGEMSDDVWEKREPRLLFILGLMDSWKDKYLYFNDNRPSRKSSYHCTVTFPSFSPYPHLSITLLTSQNTIANISSLSFPPNSASPPFSPAAAISFWILQNCQHNACTSLQPVKTSSPPFSHRFSSYYNNGCDCLVHLIYLIHLHPSI
jgi:hypothetical protein